MADVGSLVLIVVAATRVVVTALCLAVDFSLVRVITVTSFVGCTPSIDFIASVMFTSRLWG